MSLENELKKNTAAIEALTAALQGGAAPVAQPASQPAKPAENKPAKPAKAAENKPAEAAKPPAEAPAAGLTLNDLGAKFMDLCKQKGRDAAFAILGEYGASKVPDLAKQQDKFPEIIAKIDAKLEG